MPQISVIIPAYNEEKVIDDCLESLLRQSFSDFEVLIIDDCSTDFTRLHIQRFTASDPQRFFLKEYGKVGPGRARNLAAKNARGEIFAFMDADCIATPTWLEELKKGFLNDKVGSTGGPHLAPPGSSAFQLSVENLFKAAAPIIGFFKTKNGYEIVETDHNPLCNVAYRADLFQKIGGFREDIWPGEDVAIDYLVKDFGYSITYNPRAMVFHHRPEDIQQYRKVMHAYGRAQGKLIREYGIRRKLQWAFLMGVNLVLIPLIFLLFAGLWIWFLLVMSALTVLWKWRPKGNSDFSIVMNTCEWMNGLVEGFCKNRSDPPGSTRPIS